MNMNFHVAQWPMSSLKSSELSSHFFGIRNTIKCSVDFIADPTEHDKTKCVRYWDPVKKPNDEKNKKASRIPRCSVHLAPRCGSRWAHILWEGRTRQKCRGPQWRNGPKNLSTKSQKMKLTRKKIRRRVKMVNRERKMEWSTREQSDGHTRWHMKQNGMNADPNLNHACACNSLWKLDV